MGWLWELFWYGIPWEVKAIGLGLLVLFGYFLVGKLLRWPSWYTPKWLIWIAAVVAAIVGANALSQKGWRAKEKRDMADATRNIGTATKARKAAEKLAAEHPDRLRDSDGFRRD
jgi:thiol:disulfide interchange protein